MDHYKILQVNENADNETIKKAYRKLSLRYHPDKNNGKEEEFKKINEAYQTLSDPDTRQAYNFQRQNPFMGMGNMSGMSNGVPELFSALFGGGQMGPPMSGPFPFGMPGMPPGARVRIFRNGMPVHVHPRMQKPIPIVKTIEISLHQAYTGIQYPLEIERWIGVETGKVLESEKIYVNIPSGVDENEMIKVVGKGNIINENNKGDIKLFVKIKNTTKFRRKGMNLIYKKTLTLKEALTGFSFDLKFLQDKSYTINNSSAKIVTPGFKKVIPGMGMKRGGARGDLIITFDVKFPDRLTEKQTDVLKEIL